MTTTIETPVSKGDIFRCSWGYDQTNVDFFEVVRVGETGKTMWIKPISSTTVEANGPGGNKVMPLAGEYLDPIRFAWRYEWYGKPEKDGSLRKRWNGRSITLNDHMWAYPWDGEPEYETDVMFGH